MNIIDELEWRGAINQQTDEEGLRNYLMKKALHFTVELIQRATVCILDI